MKPAATIIGKVKRGVEKVAYGNPIYQKILASGSTPERLYFTPPDLWPGDAQAGMAMLAAQRSIFDSGIDAGISMSHTSAADDLRNLRAVGTDAARHMAVERVALGMARCANWNEGGWQPAALGERIMAWVGFYEFYSPAAPQDFIANLTENLQRQWKHLIRAVPATPSGLAGTNVVCGLICGGLNFADGGEGAPNALGLACDLLRRQLAAEIMPDGAHRSRNPSLQFQILRRLIDLRALFAAAELPFPEEATMAIAAMAPVLKFYRYGDGGLGLFHGSGERAHAAPPDPWRVRAHGGGAQFAVGGWCTSAR